MNKDNKSSSVKIYRNAVVCMGSTISGEVSIGPGTVINPMAKILAISGPIVIGENNLIEENAVIINECNDNEKHTMVIGDLNHFEVGSECQSRSVGNNNILEQRSYVDCRVSLSDHCVIGAGCKVLPLESEDKSIEQLPPRTAVFGAMSNRRILKEAIYTDTKKVDFLRNVMPNFHKYFQPTEISE